MYIPYDIFQEANIKNIIDTCKYLLKDDFLGIYVIPDCHTGNYLHEIISLAILVPEESFYSKKEQYRQKIKDLSSEYINISLFLSSDLMVLEDNDLIGGLKLL